MSTTIAKAHCMPPSEWPALDQKLWQAAQQRGGLLDDGGGACDWVAVTRHAAAQSYGRWLHFLDRQGLLDAAVPPAARPTRERVTAYVAELQARNAPNTVHMRVLHLSRMLEVTAPGSAPTWLAGIITKLRRARRPLRDDRARLLPVSTVMALGRRLIEEAAAKTDWPARERALHHRDGLLILILCAHAMRPRNLSLLALGKHLEKRGEAWWISFGRGQLKVRWSSMERPLPLAFNESIATYLERWRPVLLQRQSLYGGPFQTDRFWLSEAGEPMAPKQFHELIDRVFQRELGRRFNPRLFRKLQTTELAIHDPAHVGMARVLLGHASFATTDSAYNLAHGLDAARRVQATIGDLRKALRTAKPSSTRRSS